MGIDDYEKWPGLECAVSDARAVKKESTEMGFEIIFLTDHQATRANVAKILGDDLPRNVKMNDRVIIFFVGHGQTEELPASRGQEEGRGGSGLV